MKNFSPIMLIKIILVFTILGGLVYAATVYGTSTKQQLAILLHLPQTGVKGASIKPELPDALQKDISSEAAQVKKQALNIKVADILSFFARSKKIVEDAKSVTSTAESQAKKLIPHK